MSHPSHDDLVGYALGALESREARSVAKHTAKCERCATELSRLAPAIGALAESVEQVEPPESLRQSLMAEVRAEAGSAEAADAPRERRSWLRLGGLSFGPATALAGLLIIVAALVGYGVREAGEEGGTETVASPNEPEGTTAFVEISGDSATLQAKGMPMLPTGEAVYQVWVRDNGSVTPSSLLVPRPDGTAAAPVPEAADGVDAVVVTRESGPGHTIPEGPMVLSVELS